MCATPHTHACEATLRARAKMAFDGCDGRDPETERRLYKPASYPVCSTRPEMGSNAEKIKTRRGDAPNRQHQTDIIERGATRRASRGDRTGYPRKTKENNRTGRPDPDKGRGDHKRAARRVVDRWGGFASGSISGWNTPQPASARWQAALWPR